MRHFLSVIAGLLLLAAAASGRAQEGLEAAELLFTRAVVAYDDGHYAEATRDLLKARELDPRNLNVLFYLGQSYNAQGNFASAESVFRQGLAIDPKNSDLRFGLGVALYNQNKLDDALKELLALYRTEPTKDDLGYYVGLCYYQKKDYETALGYFRKNVSTSTRLRQQNQYTLGLALKALGRDQEAAEELTEAVKIEPASPLVAPTQQLLTAIKEQTGGKRLRLEATLNAHFDSNPEAENHERKSYGNLFNGRATYTFFNSGPWESTASYSFLQSLNYENHRGDITENFASINTYYRSTLGDMPTTAGLQLSNDLILLHGELYLQRPTATFTYTFQENPANFTTLILRPQYNDFMLRDRGDKKIIRRAANELAGMVHYFRFGGGRNQVGFGFHFDNEDAVTTDWSYTGYKGVASLQLALPLGLQAAANFEYHVRYYGAQKVLSGHRQDQEATLLTSLSREILPNITLKLQHFWDRNYSTLSDFNVVRQVTALGLTWRY